LYARGEITGPDGVDDPYEPPVAAEVAVGSGSVDEPVATVLAALSR